jgi:signal recognition particle subunit SRP54
MASRILGMGDVVSLVEKAQDEINQDDAMAIFKKVPPSLPPSFPSFPSR